MKIKTISLSLVLCFGTALSVNAQLGGGVGPVGLIDPALGAPPIEITPLRLSQRLPLVALINADVNGAKAILKSYGVDASDPASVEAFLAAALAEISAADQAGVLEKISEVLVAELLEGGSASDSEVTAAVKSVAKSVVKVVAANGGTAGQIKTAADSVKSGAGKAVVSAGGSETSSNSAVVTGGNEALTDAGSSLVITEDEKDVIIVAEVDDITEFDVESDDQ